MIIINNLNQYHFSYNGIPYPKVFITKISDNGYVAINEIYDDSWQLVNFSQPQDFIVDGIVYNTLEELTDNLIDVIFSRGITSEIPAYERYLGVPPRDGYVLHSLTDGTKYWGPNNGGIGEELDPLVADHIKEISLENIVNWDTAFSWGNHAEFGYITGITVSSTNTNTDTHNIAEVEGVIIKETVTKLNTPTLSGNILTLTYVNENNVTQTVNVDLSSIITNESGISNATYDAATNIITLNEVDGDIYTINLSEFSIIPSTNTSGITTLTQENVIKLTVSKVGQSGLFADLLSKPTTIAGYGITNAYTSTQINSFFSGATSISGYNKSNWDAAYAWGNHDGLYDKYQGWNLKTDGVQRVLLGPNSSLDLKGGSNISLTYANNAITLIGTNNYINSITGNGNSTLTVGRQGLTNLILDLSHNHSGVYEPVFTKNTAFNKNFGTTSGSVAQGNHSHNWSEIGNKPAPINQDNKVRVISIDASYLTTNDKAGVVNYLNTNGIIIAEDEIIAIDINTDGAVVIQETTTYMNHIGIPNNSDTSIYGISNSGVWKAVDDLVVKLKADSLYDEMLKIYLKLGDTATQQAANFIDTAVNGTFFGGWVHDATGAVANGTTTYFDAGSDFNPRTLDNEGVGYGATQVLNDIQFGTGANQCLIGGRSASNQQFLMYCVRDSDINQIDIYVGSSIVTDTTVGAGKGIHSINALGGVGTHYKNGVNSSSAVLSGSSANATIFEGAMNNGEPTAYGKGTIGASVYHRGLTDAQALNLFDALDAFETAIGRKTY